MAIRTFILEYRYPDDNLWIKYDETRVKSWAESQFEQMKKEMPGMIYRMWEKK